MRILNPANRKRVTPALFLDRDGAIIEERGYLSDPDRVSLIRGVAEIVQKAKERGWAVVIVTNQSGIARGCYGWREYFMVEERLLDLLREQDATVDAILACPYLRDPDAPAKPRDNWRKPNPGMLVAASAALALDLFSSVIAGDKASDLEAGKAAGLRCGVHVLTGHGAAEARKALACATLEFEVLQCSSVAEMAAFGKMWNA